MRGKDARSLMPLLFVVPCLALLLPGCRSLRSKPAVQPSHVEKPAPEPHAPATPTAIESYNDRERATLAAIEDFLEGTKDYQGEPKTHSPIETARAKTPGGTPPGPHTVGQSRHAEGDVGAQPTKPADRGDGVVANGQVELPADPPAPRMPSPPVIQRVAIRATVPKVGNAPLANQDVKTRAANEPLDMKAEPEPIAQEQFLAQLKSRAEASTSFDAEWAFRLAQLALGRSVDTDNLSPDLAPDSRELLTALLGATEAVRRIALNPLDMGEDALRHVDQLRAAVADRADPVVSTIALCRKVSTFGVYAPMPPESFVAGRPTQTIVYSEIENLRSERTGDGQFRTVLATRLEILSADGRSIWQHEEPEIVDLCRGRRSDFFIAQRITLPPTMAAGDYVLKVLAEDKLSGKASEATYRMTVQPAMSVATRG